MQLAKCETFGYFALASAEIKKKRVVRRVKRDKYEVNIRRLSPPPATYIRIT